VLELLYFFLAVLLMLGTMVLTSVAIILVLKFAPDVPDEDVVEQPRT